MSDDELFYLQPGFDLSSLTVPRLRGILVSHDVSYPSSAKKPQLIQILTDEVLPKARKIMSARARVKRTSRGITDMSSQDSSTVAGDEDMDAELMPPPPMPKTPRGRKSKTNLAAEADAAEETAKPSAPVRRPKTPSSRPSSSKHPRASDTETEADQPVPSARKTRKSTPGPVAVATIPAVKIQEPDRAVKRESLENVESPFTDDNPFQSGSSPMSESRKISSTSRTRKSLGASSDRKSSSRRRQTTSPQQTRQDAGIVAPSRSTFEFPVSRMTAETVERAHVPTTEEFTPEEQLELVRDRAAQGYSGTDLVPTRSKALVRRKKKPVSTTARTAPAAVFLSVLGALAAWYRKEKVDMGYCGVGSPTWSLASNPQIPAWINDNLQPACEPCPQHAYCYANMEVACETNYILQPHPLSLGGVVPLPPTCEPDGEKVKRIKVVADRAVEELRERRAAYECGEELSPVNPPATHTTDVKTIVKAKESKLEIAEEELKKVVGEARRKGMSAEEFEDLWHGALGDITGRDEIEVIRDGSGRVVSLSSSSLARLPFICALRRSLLQSLSRHRGTLSVLVLVVAAATYAQNSLVRYRTNSAQIPALVSTTLDRLATQAALAADGRVEENWISIAQLRDDVLRGTFSQAERERVWRGVRQVVEGNSNVRVGSREAGRTGEWSRVWEWIGPVNLVPGLEGRRSAGGRLLEDAAAPETETRTAAAEEGPRRGEGTEMVQRNWNEGRPIF